MAPNAGISGLAGTLPPIWTVPCKLAAGCCAVTVTTIELLRAFCGAHVADQRPSCWDAKLSGASPLENEVTTDPFRIGEPQSSVTLTSIAAGQAAGALKFAPSVVKTGNSLVGVQVAVAAGVDNVASSADDGFSTVVTTNSRSTVRVALSCGNCRTSDPR